MRYHNDWRIVYFDFFGKFIKGQPIPYPLEIYPVFGLSLCFNTFLTNEYIDRNKKQQYIDYYKYFYNCFISPNELQNRKKTSRIYFYIS